MKRREIAMAVVLGILAMSTPAMAIPGGWSIAKVDDPSVVAAAKFAVKETQAKHKKITLDKIVEARQQVVAGMNYGVELQLTDRSSAKPVKRVAEAIIYRDLSGKHSLTSWKWTKEKK